MKKNFLLSKIFLFLVSGGALFFALSGFLSGGKILTLLFLPVAAYLLLASLQTLKTGRPEVVLGEKKTGLYFYFLGIVILFFLGLRQISGQKPASSLPSASPTPLPTAILQPTEVPKRQKMVIIVPEETKAKVNLREQPNLTSKIIYKAGEGEKFVFLREIGDWYEIKYQEKSAFVNKKYSKIVQE